MKKLTVEIEGRKREVFAARSKGVLWIHLEGRTFTYEEERRAGRRAGKGQGSANPGEISAPMPGKIIKVMAAAGDRVVAHQVLIVMEAMKMEYTLKAPSEGTVAQVSVQAGQQVALGQLLIKMDPA